MTQQMTPVSLKASETALTIAWSDGVAHTVPWRVLRDHCPCATCRLQRQSPPDDDPFKILTPAEAAPLRVRGMKPVGNYAYSIDFSDGHNTGIYPLELLRHLGEAVDEKQSG